jgi:hypothetical protein
VRNLNGFGGNGWNLNYCYENGSNFYDVNYCCY